MKSVILVTLALVAIAVAAPPAEFAKLIRGSYEPQPDGSYVFGYQLDDGSARDESGVVKEVLDEDKKPHAVVVTRGSYGFISPDGTPVNIVYEADEYGFRAEGDAIPKPPARR